MEMFKTKVLENQNTHVQYFFPENCAVCDNVEKYGTAGKATDDIIMWRISFACQVTRARNQNNHNMYHLLLFHCNDGYADMPQFYVYIYTACLVHLMYSLMYPYLNGAPRLA
jgi:hypothetical protein